MTLTTWVVWWFHNWIEITHFGPENHRKDVTSVCHFTECMIWALIHLVTVASARCPHHEVTIVLFVVYKLSLGSYFEIMQILLLLLFALKLPLTDFSIHQLCLIKFTLLKISLHNGALGFMGINWWSWLISTKPLWPHTDSFVVSFPEKRGKGTAPYYSVSGIEYKVTYTNGPHWLSQSYKYTVHRLPNSIIHNFSSGPNIHSMLEHRQSLPHLWSLPSRRAWTGSEPVLVVESTEQKQEAQRDSKQWWESTHLWEGGCHASITSPRRQELVKRVRKAGELLRAMHALRCKRKGSSAQKSSVRKPSRPGHSCHVAFYPAPYSLLSHSPCEEGSLPSQF